MMQLALCGRVDQLPRRIEGVRRGPPRWSGQCSRVDERNARLPVASTTLSETLRNSFRSGKTVFEALSR